MHASSFTGQIPQLFSHLQIQHYSTVQPAHPGSSELHSKPVRDFRSLFYKIGAQRPFHILLAQNGSIFALFRSFSAQKLYFRAIIHASITPHLPRPDQYPKLTNNGGSHLGTHEMVQRSLPHHEEMKTKWPPCSSRHVISSVICLDILEINSVHFDFLKIIFLHKERKKKKIMELYKLWHHHCHMSTDKQY